MDFQEALEINQRRGEAEVTRHRDDLLNRVSSLLLANNLMKVDVARQLCMQLPGLDDTGRRELISTKWGVAYLGRVEYLLRQIATLEQAAG